MGLSGQTSTLAGLGSHVRRRVLREELWGRVVPAGVGGLAGMSVTRTRSQDSSRRKVWSWPRVAALLWEEE